MGNRSDRILRDAEDIHDQYRTGKAGDEVIPDIEKAMEEYEKAKAEETEPKRKR